MPIQMLPPEVVDKIAAGEVLERPANLVKELVENSLDSKATLIEIEFENSGRSVTVFDNGCGIAKGELKLALERHATSKISMSDDLYRLHSFGFRGEALASIAAVSDLTLTSRVKGAEGYRVSCKYGDLSEANAISAREGTEIRVNGLFENVPARLRFMKSESSEHAQIKTTIKALALANETVAFKVLSHGQLIFHYQANQDFRDRAEQILQVKKLYRGIIEESGVKIEVLVSAPNDTLKLNRGLWFFVQGRWVQDRSLTAAVMEAYRNLLMHGEYPSVVLRLQMPPDEVDVNVHPTKAQIKFRDSQLIFRLTQRVIRGVLEKAPWLSHSPKSLRGSDDFTASVQTQLEAKESNLSFNAPEFDRAQYSTKMFPLAQVREAVKAASSTDSEGPLAFRWQDLHVIGQLNQTYLVTQSSEALYLVDQHAAHERVVFERLMDSFKSGRIEVQDLLLPMCFDFSADEVEALIKQEPQIAKLGLRVERLAPESIAVRSLPSLISENAVSQTLHKLAFELTNIGDSFAWERSAGEVFASMACHSVIRAGQSQSLEQMQALLVQMDEFPLSSFCPHGRPVFVKYPFSFIEREFGRIT